MKILYLAPRVPYPPNKGDKIRSFNTVKHLSRRHDVWCACFLDDPADARHVAALAEHCREVVAVPLPRCRAALRAVVSLCLDESATEGFYRDPAMARAVGDLADRVRFDAVLAFSSGMGQYADGVRAARKVVDLCDLDSRKWADCAGAHVPPRSWMYAAEARRLDETERRLHEQFDATILVGEHEALGWSVLDRHKLHFIGNGVELPRLPRLNRYDRAVIGFVGDMRYYPNEDAVCWFVRRVWPAIAGALPAARFDIVGRSPSRAVRRLARISGVRILGEVPEVADYLLSFQVVVAPLRIARGVQNKVLEAMAAGRPVVASTPAANGMIAVSGRHFLVADRAEDVAGQVVRLLRDPHACRAMGQSARELVAARYGWDEQLLPLESLLGGQPCVERVARPAPVAVGS